MLERGLKSAKEQLEVLGAFDFSGLLHQLHRLVHVLLWFAAVAFDVIKMAQTTFPVYRENCFSVDFEENPMFMRVKQGSLFWNVGLAGVLLSVLCERCVGPEVDIVVGVEYPGAALHLKGYHHQLDNVRRQCVRQGDPVVLLDQACPGKPDVGVAVMRLAVDLAALLDGCGNNVAHGQIG
jgi:hypothetical protein